jgi:hypothetical protein
LEFLKHITDPLLVDVARMVFGAMMVKVSNYRNCSASAPPRSWWPR